MGNTGKLAAVVSAIVGLFAFSFSPSVHADERCQRIIDSELARLGFGSFDHPAAQVSKFQKPLFRDDGDHDDRRGELFTFDNPYIGRSVRVIELKPWDSPGDLKGDQMDVRIDIHYKIDAGDHRWNIKTVSLFLNSRCELMRDPFRRPARRFEAGVPR